MKIESDADIEEDEQWTDKENQTLQVSMQQHCRDSGRWLSSPWLNDMRSTHAQLTVDAFKNRPHTSMTSDRIILLISQLWLVKRCELPGIGMFHHDEVTQIW